MQSYEATVALVRPIAAQIAHLEYHDRIYLLCALLTQEICMLPAGERASVLDAVIQCLPDTLRVTEDEMRRCLVENARSGL